MTVDESSRRKRSKDIVHVFRMKPYKDPAQQNNSSETQRLSLFLEVKFLETLQGSFSVLFSTRHLWWRFRVNSRRHLEGASDCKAYNPNTDLRICQALLGLPKFSEQILDNNLTPVIFQGILRLSLARVLKIPRNGSKCLKGDETQSLANVVFYLEGTAAQWFDNNEDIINSWTQFKTDLCEVFGQKEELTRRAEMTLKTRAQKPGETTESCIQQILSLCS
ncbi:hypothetical protein LAZ67_4002470 [Cordylochernes scorpioides]|uniref:Retrotransposon gag domain-containing protein n=1 Tax=Cordylochernes scorpioides TaxID=51811 RepID=A0ABY6KFU4_9ARAC|nr:hypothetical protein LAZ67_4002470 [Cordylochernes scorpioides]